MENKVKTQNIKKHRKSYSEMLKSKVSKEKAYGQYWERDIK